MNNYYKPQMLLLTFPEQLLCAGSLLSTLHEFFRVILTAPWWKHDYPPFMREETNLDRLSGIPQFTQLLSGIGGICIQAYLTPKPSQYPTYIFPYTIRKKEAKINILPGSSAIKTLTGTKITNSPGCWGRWPQYISLQGGSVQTTLQNLVSPSTYHSIRHLFSLSYMIKSLRLVLLPWQLVAREKSEGH